MAAGAVAFIVDSVTQGVHAFQADNLQRRSQPCNLGNHQLAAMDPNFWPTSCSTTKLTEGLARTCLRDSIRLSESLSEQHLGARSGGANVVRKLGSRSAKSRS